MCEFAYDQHKICREVKTSFNQLVRSVLEDIGLFSFFSIYTLRPSSSPGSSKLGKNRNRRLTYLGLFAPSGA